jgi:hypothetical protein
MYSELSIQKSKYNQSNNTKHNMQVLTAHNYYTIQPFITYDMQPTVNRSQHSIKQHRNAYGQNMLRNSHDHACNTEFVLIGYNETVRYNTHT